MQNMRRSARFAKRDIALHMLNCAERRGTNIAETIIEQNANVGFIEYKSTPYQKTQGEHERHSGHSNSIVVGGVNGGRGR